MNEPEMFIVTVIFGSENYETDMELPAELPVSELCRKLLDVLKNLYEGEFAGWKSCVLEYDYRVLDDNETLMSAGVYDGSRLYVIEN